MDRTLPDPALLATSRAWQHGEARRISDHVRARNGGQPAHRLPIPSADDQADAGVTLVIEPETVAWPAVATIGEAPAGLRSLTRDSRHPRPGIDLWRIAPAYLLALPGSFVVADRNGRIVAEASSRGSSPLAEILPLVMESKDPLHVAGRSVLLADGLPGRNYCHWMTDQLNRLAVYERARVTPATALLSSIDTPFQVEGMASVTDLADSIVELRTHPFVHADELYVSSNVGVDLCHPAHRGAPWALDFLVSRLATHARGPAERRIYVSRRDARRRFVRNEDELVAELTRRDFDVITLDGLTVGEQARLFDESSVVVGAHGAGLSNLLFARASTRVLELFPASYGTPSFAILALSRGQRYTGMRCESIAAAGWETQADDLAVDIGAVTAWVDGIGT